MASHPLLPSLVPPSPLSHLSHLSHLSPAMASSSRLPASHDVHATWEILGPGIDQIMTRLREGMNNNDYMKLYTLAYNHCTSSRMTAGSADLSGSVGSKSMPSPCPLSFSSSPSHPPFLPSPPQPAQTPSAQSSTTALFTTFSPTLPTFASAQRG